MRPVTTRAPLALTLPLLAFLLSNCGPETADFSGGTPTSVPENNVPSVNEDKIPNEVSDVPTQPTPEEDVTETPPADPETPVVVEDTTPPPPTPRPDPMDPPPPPVPRALVQTFEGAELETAKSPDIIFLIDTSASMIWEKEAIERESERLVKRLLSYNIKDFQLFMVGDNHSKSANLRFNFPAEMFAYDNFDVVDATILSNNSLDVFQDFLDGKHTSRLEVRKDHPQEVIVVTDDNFGSPVFRKTDEEHVKKVRGRVKDAGHEKVHFNGIIGLPNSKTNANCNISKPGSVYQKLVQEQTTPGFIQDLCEEDWGKLLENFADFIVERTLTATFKLEKAIDPTYDVVVKVNGTTVDAGRYTIDLAANTVTFKKGHIPAKGAAIEVTYFGKK